METAAKLLLAGATLSCLTGEALADKHIYFRDTLGAKTTRSTPGPQTPPVDPEDPETPVEPEVPLPSCSLTIDASRAAGYPSVLSDTDLVFRAVSDAPLPPGGHFELEGAGQTTALPEGLKNEFDATTGTYLTNVLEAGHYSYRINYVPDAPNAFVPCSTPDFAFTVTLDEAQAREMVLQQCTDPGLGYDGLEGQGFTFSYNRALPRGTILSQADGKVHGTITEAVGSYGPYRLKVAMDGMESMFGELLSFTIAAANVVNFNQGTPDAKVGQPYHIQFGFTGIGGNISYSFDPPLPAWLVRDTSLDPSRYGYAYNGTPTTTNVYTGVATITSACGVKDSAPFTIRTLP